jgi:hypothetical protein
MCCCGALIIEPTWNEANGSRRPKVIIVKQHESGLKDTPQDFLNISEDAESRDSFLRILSGVEENQESDALVEGDGLVKEASDVENRII